MLQSHVVLSDQCNLCSSIKAERGVLPATAVCRRATHHCRAVKSAIGLGSNTTDVLERLSRSMQSHLGQLADEGDAALALGVQLGLDALLPVRLIRKRLSQRLQEQTQAADIHMIHLRSGSMTASVSASTWPLAHVGIVLTVRALALRYRRLSTKKPCM